MGLISKGEFPCTHTEYNTECYVYYVVSLLCYRNDIYTNSRDAYKTWLSHGVTKEGRGEARKGNKKEKEKKQK